MGNGAAGGGGGVPHPGSVSVHLMRLVIDSNQLQAPELRAYLSASTANYAVLTDYVAMEAYKGDTLASIYKSMSIICEYPKQVIVLKSTRVACGQRGRLSGLQRRLIDDTQTLEFPKYSKHLAMAKNGEKKYVDSIVAHGKEANGHMETLLRDAAEVGIAIEELSKDFTKEERAAFREGNNLQPHELMKAQKKIMLIAANLFKSHPEARWWPTAKELPYTFIFRSALCMYLLALDWAANGGVRGVSAEKLRNDVVDMNFATYGTYFEGLLSRDAKTIRLHREARLWLSGLFGCEIPGGVLGRSTLVG